MDYMLGINAVAETIAKGGEPLTENQKLMMAGALGVWFDKLYNEGYTDGALEQCGKVPNDQR